MMQTLYLIRGVPGSGKSSLAQTLLNSGVVDVKAEADDLFLLIGKGEYSFDPSKLKEAHEWCQETARVHLKNGDNVAVSNTSTTEKEVAVYQQIAELTGSKFVSIILEHRHQGENVHGVPSVTIDKMRQRFSIKL